MMVRTIQIVGRERRKRISQLTWYGGGCFDSCRRVNSNVGHLPFLMLSRFKCVVVFLFVACPLIRAQSNDAHGLVLRGKALKTWTDRSRANYVDLRIDLSLKFSNTGTAPIIMMRPWHDGEFWQGGSMLATTLQNAQSNAFVFDDAAWESISGDDAYRKLSRDLDQREPPPTLTRVLKPGESCDWQTTVTLRFEATTNHRYPRVPTWEEMKTQPSPLWLRVSFEMWPFNVEYFKPNLAAQLQKRWRKIGWLWIGYKFGRMHLARLASEPIELNWHAVLTH